MEIIVEKSIIIIIKLFREEYIMALIPKFYMDSVVSIGIKNNGKVKWIGTGFIVAKAKNEKEVWLYLVTNKHVLKNKSEIWIRIGKEGSNETEEIEISLLNQNNNPNYSVHPDDKVDIAAIFISGGFLMENNYSTGFLDIDKNAMTSEELRNHGVSEGNLAYMLGYPMGLVNVKSKNPICRMGCIARMSNAQIEDTKNILMDIQNFPGNSGSPVVLKPEFTSITGTEALSRSVLIGIIHSYIPYREALISEQTGETVEMRIENSGLAYMHPVEFIRKVVNMEYENKNM